MTRAANLVLGALGVVVAVAGQPLRRANRPISPVASLAMVRMEPACSPGVPGLTATDGPLALADEVLVKRTAGGFQSPGAPMAMPLRGATRG